MSFSGTFVVARPQGRLTEQEGIAGFGFQQLRLRNLNDGWQLLTTLAFLDPPDLPAACRALADSTGRPVFAAGVFESSCATYSTGIPGETGALRHLWRLDDPGHGYQHVPRGMRGPVRSRLVPVVDELCSWSVVAGLTASPRRLTTVVSARSQPAEDAVIELIKALGLPHIGPGLPRAFDMHRQPYRMIAVPYAGLGAVAKIDKANGRPPESWSEPAIALVEEMWTTLHRPDADMPALLRKMADVKASAMAGPVGSSRGIALFREMFPDPVDTTWVPEDRRALTHWDRPSGRWATTG